MGSLKKKTVYPEQNRSRRVYPEQSRKVFVGLSGGVDSSVAALLLKKEGYNVIGVHLKCWNENGCDEIEAEYARRVAEALKIPFYTFDLEKEYEAKVVRYMIDGYKKGITPNPDVMCNREIKFGLFLKKALELGADYIATGHYVKLAKKGSKYALIAANDKNKDQSYFLWTLTQNDLKYCLFPIGEYKKPEIRKIAKRTKLPTADKKDSQGICFIGKISVSDFLRKYIPIKKGNVITKEGKIIGTHDGVYFYTIGQRTGLGNLKKEKGEIESKPYYVAGKNIKKNELIVVRGENNETLYKKEVTLTNVNFITPHTQYSIPDTVLARVRYRQPLSKANFKKVGSRYELIFEKPQKFVAEGQSAVFYQRNPSVNSGHRSGEFRMLGGGIIV